MTNTLDSLTINILMATGTMSFFLFSNTSAFVYTSNYHHQSDLHKNTNAKIYTSILGSFHSTTYNYSLELTLFTKISYQFCSFYFILTHIFNKIGAGGKRAKGSAFQTVSSLYRVNRNIQSSRFASVTPTWLYCLRLSTRLNLVPVVWNCS